jgi:hypothetical protein
MCQNTPNKIIDKIPKIICGSIIAIFIAVVGYASLSSFWFWTALEVFGGASVAVGCVGELYLFANPADENDELQKAHHRHRELQCIMAVAIGVTVEFIALFHAIQEGATLERATEQLASNNLVLRSNVAALELQVMEAKTNIASIDPRNANISEISAIVFFTKMGMDLNELTNLPSGRAAQLSLWKDERLGTVLDSLTAANGDVSEYNPILAFGKRDRRIYRMQFHSLNFQLAQGIEHPVKMLDDVHLVHIDLNFLPRDSEIGGASVELIINNFHKMFFAPEQNDTNSNMGWQAGFPCWFVATNGVQSSEKQFLYLRN